MLEQFSPRVAPALPAGPGPGRPARGPPGDRRRQFVARCATGDWDAVIMSRSAFERIPHERRRAAASTWTPKLDRMRDCHRRRPREGDGLTRQAAGRRPAARRGTLKAKLDSAKDPGITFEATGIDYLFVDEAHGYKNLRTPSNIPDAAIDGSMRASDLDMKIGYLAAAQRQAGRHLRHRHPDRQLRHRGVRDAALPAAGPARSRRDHRLRHLGRHLRRDRRPDRDGPRRRQQLPA